jgi:release factor glutamine methyltransferase
MSQTIAALLQNCKVDQLDAEILLAHVLNVSRSYLYAWPEKMLSAAQEKIFFELIDRRINGEPVAYLIGHQEFWSLDFLVTQDVLIPRPETELLVEMILEIPAEQLAVADLGAGSGAIALSIAHERPNWEVHATDASHAALQIAKKNAERLKIKNITFHDGDWLQALPSLLFDVIVSNPPYIAANDAHLLQLTYEPQSALISGPDGLEDIRKIIRDAGRYLKSDGYLMLEHGYDQADEIRKLFETAGYKNVFSIRDLSGNERVTYGKK